MSDLPTKMEEIKKKQGMDVEMAKNATLLTGLEKDEVDKVRLDDAIIRAKKSLNAKIARRIQGV